MEMMGPSPKPGHELYVRVSTLCLLQQQRPWEPCIPAAHPPSDSLHYGQGVNACCAGAAVEVDIPRRRNLAKDASPGLRGALTPSILQTVLPPTCTLY